MIGFAVALGAVSMRAGGGGAFYRTVLATAGCAAVVVGAIWLIP